jgi:hypothetical protein
MVRHTTEGNIIADRLKKLRICRVVDWQGGNLIVVARCANGITQE